MYNRYIPQQTVYTSVEPEGTQQRRQTPAPPKESGPRPVEGLANWFSSLWKGEGGAALTGLWSGLKHRKPDAFDSGDLLLLLVLLLLLKEGEDLEPVLALGLVLLLGLGEEKADPPEK